jgi:hypothetical protein
MPLMPDLVSSLRERNTWAPDRLLLQRFGGKVDRGLALELLRRRPTPWHLYHPMASPPRRHMSPGTLNIPCHRVYAMPSSGLSLYLLRFSRATVDKMSPLQKRETKGRCRRAHAPVPDRRLKEAADEF